MNAEVMNGQLEELEPCTTEDQGSSILDFLLVLSRRRRFILLFTVVTVLATVVLVLLLPSQYTAETVILPPAQGSSIGSALLSQLGGNSALTSIAGASLGIKSQGDLYIALLRSRTIEDAVIGHFGLMARYRCKKMSDARHSFESHSKLILGPKDGLIRIDVNDRDPRFAAEVANGYVEEYRKQSANMAVTEASQRRLFFQEQLRDAEEDLTTAEESLKHTEQKTGLLQVDSQARLLMESAASLRAQIVGKEVNLKALSSFGTANNPEIVTAQQELLALKAQYAKLTGAGNDANDDILISRGKIPEAGLEYIRRLRDVRYYETIVELLAKQFEVAKLDEARQGAIIQVVDLAVPPDGRSFPKRTLTVGLVLILSFFAACGFVAMEEQTRRMLHNPIDRRKFGLLRASLRKGL